MAKFKLSRSNYSLIPEGRHTFHIDQVQYNEAFGKMVIRMTADGKYKHSETFNLLDNNGEPNDKAMSSFTFLAKCAMNKFDDEAEFDEQDLEGLEFDGDIVHWESPTAVDDNGNPRKYANLTRKYPIPREKEEETVKSEESSDTLSSLMSSLGI